MCNACLSRRGLFSGMGALAVTAAAGTALPRAAMAQPSRSAETPDAALSLLMEGNARYVSGKLAERDFSAGRAARALGQAPFAAILGCADSRVAPELVFDQTAGELFIVRVAGNFVTPDGLGSLEYGAAVLGTKVIMVLGHTSCGAVNATVEALQKGNTLPGHIADLVRAMKPGIEPVLKTPGDDLRQRAVVANIQSNVRRLQTEKPILGDMVAAGKLKVVGAYYDLPTGKVIMV
ncbi:carbonic anhydrase [Reyranella aquatilis]|uniref:carbonic anhydrase n=1 Tax=Reyranella aquatilis TaxID=2035356 RepID=A0ABS8KUW2_9HYPH|nr:carbonic anhydrase [Reyranella aquatilis]MCC8429868.1 carbonic anhydrase [Reyranella aquatilis]